REMRSNARMVYDRGPRDEDCWLDLLVTQLCNPVPSPFHRFQFEITDATGEEDDALNPPLPQPAQAQLALVLHQVKRHRLLPRVIPKITAQHQALSGSYCFQPFEIALQLLELLRIPGPEAQHVQMRQVRAKRPIK